MNFFSPQNDLREFDLSPQGPDALLVKNLFVQYRKRIALDHIAFNLPKGSLTALIGPNGGGKSSLLKALLGLIPFEGNVSFDRTLRESIAYLPQKNDIDISFPLSVFDVVGAGLCQKKGFFQAYSKGDKQTIMHALGEVGLADVANRTLGALSGGQVQRVLFARAMVQNAPLVLLDEPFTAIDSYTTDALIDIIHKWSRGKKTILVVCHDLELVEEHFPQTLLLAQRIIAQGPTDQVITKENIKEAKRIAQNLEHLDSPTLSHRRSHG